MKVKQPAPTFAVREVMNWTPDEERQLGVVYGRLVGRVTAFELTRAIADKATELLRVRGGTMTAERLADLQDSMVALSHKHPAIAEEIHEALQHIAAQGAKSTTLSEKVARLQAKVTELTGWLADLTEILCGERPHGVMAETTKDAARALKARLAALEQQNASLFKTASDRGHKIDALKTEQGEWCRKATGAQRGCRLATEELARLSGRCCERDRDGDGNCDRHPSGLKLNPPTSSESLGQVAEDEKRLRCLIFAAAPDHAIDDHRALSRLAALAQQGQGLKRRLREAGDERDEFPAAVASDERKAGWHAAVDFIAGADAATALSNLKAFVRPTHTHEWVASAVGTEACTGCEERRYPCSDACTHDDAKEPGHAERVAARSQAFAEIATRETHRASNLTPEPIPLEQCTKETIGYLRASEVPQPTQIQDDAGHDVTCDTCAETTTKRLTLCDTCQAKDREQAAEAMRAACWEAVRGACQRLGLHPNEKATLKAAIEGLH